MMLPMYRAYHRCSPLYCNPAEDIHFTVALVRPCKTREMLEQEYASYGAEMLTVKEAPEATIADFLPQIPPNTHDPRNTKLWIVVCKAVLL